MTIASTDEALSRYPVIPLSPNSLNRKFLQQAPVTGLYPGASLYIDIHLHRQTLLPAILLFIAPTQKPSLTLGLVTQYSLSGDFTSQALAEFQTNHRSYLTHPSVYSVVQHPLSHLPDQT